MNLKLRLVLQISILVFSSGTWGKDCSSAMQDYVIRGDLKSNAVGARLWRIPALKKDAAANKECAKELFNQATSEAEAYWNHIDKKYECGALSSGPHDSEKCSDTLSDKVLSNRTYLAMIKAEGDYHPTNCQSGGRKQGPLSKVQADNMSDMAGLLGEATKPADQCASVPLKDRISSSSGNSPEADLAEDISKSLGTCLWGAIEGFFKEGIYNSLKSIWDSLKDPWGSLAALRDIAIQLAKNPKETIAQIAKNLGDSLYSTFLKKYEKFDCYNPQKKSEVMCSSIGQGAAAVVEALLGAKAFTSGSQLIKKIVGSKKSTKVLEGEYLEKPKQLSGPNSKAGNTIDGEYNVVKEQPALNGPPKSSNLMTSGANKSMTVRSSANSKTTGVAKTNSNTNARAKAEADARAKAEADAKSQGGESDAAKKARREKINYDALKSLLDSEAVTAESVKRHLGLPSTTNKQALVKELRALIQQYHPDKNKASNAEEISKILTQILNKVK
ncbi:MAG: J domain-containing protein [Bdellovibrio sp.]